MNGFTAADMNTAAASAHNTGYQAGYADAVKAFDAAQPAAAPVDVIAGILSDLSAVACSWTVEAVGAGADARNDCAAQMLEAIEQQSIKFGLFDASTPAAPGIDHLRSVINVLSRNISDAYEAACRNGDERMQAVQNARQSLLNTIREALPTADASPKGGSAHVRTMNIPSEKEWADGDSDFLKGHAYGYNAALTDVISINPELSKSRSEAQATSAEVGS